jgi:hypothetical protein
MRKHSFIVLLAVLGLAFLAVFSWAVVSVSKPGSKVPPSASITTAPPSRAGPTAPPPGPITSSPAGPTAPPPPGPITSEAPGPTAAPPGPITSAAPPGPTPSPGFARIRDEESGLVTANAYWRGPDALTVNQSDQIGLGIQSAPLASKISEQLKEVPGTTQPAGQIRISPNATATLEANSGDADVTPNGSQDSSTPEDIEMSWKWTVTPKRPTSNLLWRPTRDLILTAYIVVHLEGGPNDVVTTTKTLHIPVHRTFSYTADQLRHDWGTWAGILGVPSVAGAIAWFRKRKRGQE